MKEPVFKYPDTNSSRAKIDFLNRKFEAQKIAIVGVGGTGSYILDLASKTPVSEIHLFDNDPFLLHNAFRAPGAINGNLLEENVELKKVNYFHSIYSKMHNRIFVHDELIDESNVNQLGGFSIVFLCVDTNKVRSMLVNKLMEMKVRFIDAGLGVNLVDDSLIGTIRVTTATSEKYDHLEDRIGQDDLLDNEYATNIQIADLNCMAAVLAVLKWKKLAGFYQDLKGEHNSLFFINTNKLLNEDFGS